MRYLLLFTLLHTARAASAETPALAVPSGFTIEKVAGSPLVEHPMFACFDDRGRLFVTEAAGVNLRADDLLKAKPNRILLLEDTKGNGVFDKSTVFADGMTLPMGVLWHRGALYTCSPPSLWKLEDTTGAGKANKRTELVTKFGFTGNAADIHGPFLAPDGRLYWCDGRHGHTIKQPDGKVLAGKAARIFRCKLDGSEIETVCGGGMDNPVEIAFTEEGEALATCNILLPRPRVDAILHCIEGGVWPWHEVHNEFPRTGDLLPAASELGWVAPSGLMRYKSEALGKDHRDNLFSAQFNRHRIQRHVLTRDGATFRMTNEDFLTSASQDFHPTDVLEDADGSLLVIDTGGWFRIGCPTSQIAKPDIKGAIYRIRRKGAAVVQDPRGISIPWTRLEVRQIIGLLDDARPAVRERAIEELARMGNASVAGLKGVLQGKATPRARRNAVWTLARMENAEARAEIRLALADADSSVRQAGAHALGLQRDAESLQPLMKLLGDSSVPVQRDAATALGRLRKVEAVPALLQALGKGGDRFLEHAQIHALIAIGDAASARKGLQDASLMIRRAALIALDQMANGNLTQDEAVSLLGSADAGLQRTALDIVSRRPGWAADVVGLLRKWLGEDVQDVKRRDSLRSALLALGRTEAVQALLADVLVQGKSPAGSRLIALETMTRVPPAKLPKDWLTALHLSLNAREPAVVLQAIAAIEANRIKESDGHLHGVARDRSRPVNVRVAALSVAGPRLTNTEEGWFELLLGQLGSAQPLDRLAAAQALARMPLDLFQLETLPRAVAAAGPLELPHLLAPFEGKNNPAVGRKLVAALRDAKGFDALSADAVRRLVQTYPAEVRSAAFPLIQRLEASLEQQRGKLRQLESFLTGGDAKRGRDVFFGKKAVCSACHRVRGEGETFGPDLSTIGAIRPGRDLLESLVFPSASFVRGYEPYQVTTRAGKVFNGILARETAEHITLVTTERNEVSIPRAEIESFELGKTSIMPQGLDAQLSRDELRDLLAFLQSLR